LVGSIFREWGFKFAYIKGLAKIGEIWRILKFTAACRNALLFGMEYPWDKEIQVCGNEVPGVKNGLA